jgi:hypothetical protein
MPRRLRLENPGAAQNLMNRGDRREVRLHDDRDRDDAGGGTTRGAHHGAEVQEGAVEQAERRGHRRMAQRGSTETDLAVGPRSQTTMTLAWLRTGASLSNCSRRSGTTNRSVNLWD